MDAARVLRIFFFLTLGSFLGSIPLLLATTVFHTNQEVAFIIIGVFVGVTFLAAGLVLGRRRAAERRARTKVLDDTLRRP